MTNACKIMSGKNMAIDGGQCTVFCRLRFIVRVVGNRDEQMHSTMMPLRKWSELLAKAPLKLAHQLPST